MQLQSSGASLCYCFSTFAVKKLPFHHKLLPAPILNDPSLLTLAPGNKGPELVAAVTLNLTVIMLYTWGLILLRSHLLCPFKSVTCE